MIQIARVALRRAVVLAGWTCAMLVTESRAQPPAPTSIWQRILYPDVAIPRAAGEVLTFSVGSGGHTNRPDAEPSQLRLDLAWGAPNGVRMPRAVANARNIVVRLHTAYGKIITPSRAPFEGWVGIGGGLGMSWYLTNMVPWSRNGLDEAWFEVRVPGQTWWIELPYGFARNPEDPEIPDRDRGEPKFLSGMRLGAKDILVPWLAVEYEIGRIHNDALLSVKLGNNPFGASASVTLHRDGISQNLDTPRIAVSIETGADTLTGREYARRLLSGYRRTDDFALGTTVQTGRAFGTVIISIDGQRYRVRVPSSLFHDFHGRTDYENKQWLVAPPERAPWYE